MEKGTYQSPGEKIAELTGKVVAMFVVLTLGGLMVGWTIWVAYWVFGFMADW